MEFTKIKLSKNRIHLEYLIRKDNDHTDFTFDHPDDSLLSFSQSLKALREDFLKVLELPNDAKMIERTSLHTISISYKGEDHNRSVIISGNIATSNGSFNVNSPLQRMDCLEGEGLTVETFTKIEKVIQEATKYVNGERQQTEMFEKEEAIV